MQQFWDQRSQLAADTLHVFGSCLLQVLGLFSLSMMSTAAIIGAGIFVLTGVVAKQAG